MSIDIKAIEAEARKEIADEGATKAKSAIKQQLRNVEAARQVLANEERKLEDLKSRITDGEF